MFHPAKVNPLFARLPLFAAALIVFPATLVRGLGTVPVPPFAKYVMVTAGAIAIVLVKAANIGDSDFPPNSNSALCKNCGPRSTHLPSP